MKTRWRLNALLVLGGLGIIGCSSATTQTFDVKVENQTARPVTVWLTKDGPPFEAKWASPEDVATERPGGSDVYLGVDVPPGKTGATGPVPAKLDPGTRAWLRVYSGVERFSDLLAKTRGSASRLDIELQPGVNHYVVTDRNGRLEASRSSTSTP